jgi:hypothetical protein
LIYALLTKWLNYIKFKFFMSNNVREKKWTVLPTLRPGKRRRKKGQWISGSFAFRLDPIPTPKIVHIVRKHTWECASYPGPFPSMQNNPSSAVASCPPLSLKFCSKIQCLHTNKVVSQFTVRQSQGIYAYADLFENHLNQ